MLNLPTQLYRFKNTLYFGIGGGYDVFGAIPLHTTLGTKSQFVSIGSTPLIIPGYDTRQQATLHSQFGANKLAWHLESMVKANNIDTIVAIDGGVDSLMFGDEADSGTVLQDFNSLAALSRLRDRVSCDIYLACLGFGCETDENLNHYAVLQNIATLSADGSFLGTCALNKRQTSFQKYQTAVEHESNERKSHIQTRVVAAVNGGFGVVETGDDPNLDTALFDVKYPVFINPLMSMYWFFSFDGIEKHNKVIQHLKHTDTISESMQIYRKIRTRERLKQVIPL